MKEKLDELITRLEQLLKAVNFPAKKLALLELKKSSENPNLWQDQDKAKHQAAPVA